MDIHHKTKPYDQPYSFTTPTIQDKKMGQNKNFITWFTLLLSFQAEIIYNCIVTLLSPFVSASESPPQVQETEPNIEAEITQHGEANIITLLVKKIGLGLLSAAYVCMVLVFVMILAMILGVGLVRVFVEEPVFMREELSFDYGAFHPKALFLPRGGVGGGDGGGFVPVGHTFYVSLVLLMPESDYNRDVGVFQVTAELLGVNGDVAARSSHPCMMRFRSWPVRTFHTFFKFIPLLLGITSETQRLSIPLLKHKETLPRTEAIRFYIIPRAGTLYLPQVYEAEILMNSQLPWKKELVRRWKWTFYVWTSFYIYILLLILLFLFFKPLTFPGITSSINSYRGQEAAARIMSQSQPDRGGNEDQEVSERWRRLHQRRNKRKAMIFESSMSQPDSSTSSITFTSPSLDEDVGDSESVFGGR